MLRLLGGPRWCSRQFHIPVSAAYKSCRFGSIVGNRFRIFRLCLLPPHSSPSGSLASAQIDPNLVLPGSFSNAVLSIFQEESCWLLIRSRFARLLYWLFILRSASMFMGNRAETRPQ